METAALRIQACAGVCRRVVCHEALRRAARNGLEQCRAAAGTGNTCPYVCDTIEEILSL